MDEAVNVDVEEDDDIDDDDENDSTCSIASSSSSSSSSSSLWMMDDDMSMGDDSDIITHNFQQQQQQQQMPPNKQTTKSVRFSDTIEMRNYSVVLSDHPLCEDGLAVELGWYYDPNDVDLIDLDTHEEYKSIIESAYHQQQQQQQQQQQMFVVGNNTTTNNNNRRRSARPSWSGRSSGLMGSTVQRRTTLEKQQLLHNVGGYSLEELQTKMKEAIMKRQASIVLDGRKPLVKSASTASSSSTSRTTTDLVSLVDCVSETTTTTTENTQS